MILSIIVPIYNGEKTLPTLLEPILKIERRDIEIILVDDGSKDNSYALCKQYAEKDSRVITVHIENSGVSAARNKGLDIAKGEYIYFCDCDDKIYSDAFIDVISFLTSCKYDIVMAGYIYNNVFIKKAFKADINVTPVTSLNKQDIVTQFISPLILFTGTHLAALWNKFFKASIITNNAIHFNPNIHKGEDWQFILSFLRFAESAYYTPEPIYEYKVDGSQTESKYRKEPGVHLLISNKLKMSLADEFSISVPPDTLLQWYVTQIDELVFSANSNLNRTQWKQIVSDKSVTSAAKALFRLDKNNYYRLEISRKYKIYSLFLLLRFKNILRPLIKRMSK